MSAGVILCSVQSKLTLHKSKKVCQQTKEIKKITIH
jgi:hypothetical protein